MKEETKGWVIATYNHPATGSELILTSTFSNTKKEAIQQLIKVSAMDWSYWKKYFNFQAVKAIKTIELITK